MKKKILLALCGITILCAGTVAWAMGGTAVPQKAVISGEVTSTVEVNQNVTAGTSLVEVGTLTGTTAAARSTVDGKVTQVLVKPGDQVNPDQIVVYVEE